MSARICTVEYDARWNGWIARDPYTGKEIMEEGFRWNSRSVARTVVAEARIMSKSKPTDGAKPTKSKGQAPQIPPPPPSSKEMGSK